ncbi:Transcriptional regulator GlxA family, contains an amidase domain and an AraC-type DNA-binding HTH domain [Pseudomonas linyingensis]|uniref:Transcriptional regulator GlxA family, contains an amidase domain and an AraC-type DNA-binding HTH domain n=1 Tax=Pseudomonas linyingensis TaxID=915471 RepID=A0A1H7BCZ4_9PSED|nr:GlxA family transcriptional regulator [Pseudomonas linyingensis]SEJ72372.1 Transcriptional regulator GlxA family, contains an amidase domain and an AraC-type DNA-binding HTH domain [Pseudomonas linyingensis]
MTPVHLAFLYWPDVRPLTLSLIDEALQLAARLHPEALYEVAFLQAEPRAADGWPLPGAPWQERLSGSERLFLLAEEPPAEPPAALQAALRELAGNGALLGGVAAGVYPLAQLGLLDGFRVALHWRWQDDFTERFAQVATTDHLFEWDRERLTACGGLAVLDMLLAMLARDHGGELASAIAAELMLERIREGGERQRAPQRNRLGATHPKLSQALLLMEANIEEPLTTDEIAQQVCVSRRQLERIFKQFLNRVPSQYYLELRLNRARQLLQQTSTSIIQIGLSCGFSSGPHFSSAYRNFFGVTPRDDRNLRRSAVAAAVGR